MTLSRNIANIIVHKGVKVDDVVEALRTYKLLSLLPSIHEAVVKLTRDKGRDESIRIESPFEIHDDTLGHIKRIVGNSSAKTEVTINKNILAGFKARFKGHLYDGSAERIIRQLTK